MPPNIFFKRCWICLSFERLTQSETMSVVDMLESSHFFQYSIVNIPKLDLCDFQLILWCQVTYMYVSGNLEERYVLSNKFTARACELRKIDRHH